MAPCQREAHGNFYKSLRALKCAAFDDLGACKRFFLSPADGVHCGFLVVVAVRCCNCLGLDIGAVTLLLYNVAQTLTRNILEFLPLALFWLIAILVTGLALCAYLLPVWRTPRGAAVSDDAQVEWQAAWQVLAAQREELEADVVADTLTVEAKAESLREWAARTGALYESSAATKPAGGATLQRWAPFVASAVVLLSGGLYLTLGNPQAVALKGAPMDAAEGAVAAATQPGAHSESPAQVQAMVKALEAKLEKEPDNVSGWALLARSKASLGDFAGAAAAYEKTIKLAQDNPDILTDYADVLAMASGRKLEGRPTELIMQALAIDPKHRKALALAATAAMRSGKMADAAGYWRRLRATFADGSDDAREIDAVIAQMSGKAPPAEVAAAADAPVASAPVKPAATGAVQSVSGSVEITPALKASIKPGSTLFVFARAASGGNGPRMPLAVLRSAVPDFPFAFKLDDSMAMAPGMNLSSAGEVEVEARISASGQAIAQAGDLRGKVTAIKPGSSGLRIVIDSVQP